MNKFILARILAVFCCFYIAGSCFAGTSSSNAPKLPVPSRSLTPSLPQPLPFFERLNADGAMTVTLMTGAHPDFTVSSNVPQAVTAQVRNGTLYLQRKTGVQTTTPIKVQVWIKSLTNITAAHDSMINANNLNSTTPLTLQVSTNASLYLLGTLNVQNIMVDDAGDVTLRWVDSDQLHIQGTGSGRIQLAGTAQTLNARLSGGVQLDAPYLRSKRAYVQTRDQAQASILAQHTLSAFAYDQSNIYYYKIPEQQLTRDSVMAGNVLQMQDWR